MAPKSFRQSVRRRDLIKLAWAGVALPIPPGSEGQRSGMPVVGVLSNGSASTRQPTVNAILEGLAETGFVDGQNVAIEFRWAGDDYDRFPELIADLMRRSVAVIVASGLNAALASKRSTATIPIIFGVGDDPVKHGLVTGFNHPGGNATGVSIQIAGLIGKRLSLLRELVPDAASIAVLINPNDAQASRQIAEVREASNALGQPIELLNANTEREIEPAFASMARSGAKGLVLGVEQFFLSRRVQLVGLADRYAIPTIYALRAFVEAGGLLSYGPDLAYGDRQLGIYTGKILAGANPGDLPHQRPSTARSAARASTRCRN
jgi:putative tryptophan/tyrosine transport system substrate-binding protein